MRDLTIKEPLIKSILLFICFFLSFTSNSALAITERYVGEIILVGFNYCPRGTTEANGQLLAINKNTALFSLYGTYYGGDGRTSFGLPDLRKRAAISQDDSNPLGEVKTSAAGNQKNDVSFLTLRYCVVLEGLYPSRP